MVVLNGVVGHHQEHHRGQLRSRWLLRCCHRGEIIIAYVDEEESLAASYNAAICHRSPVTAAFDEVVLQTTAASNDGDD